MELPVAACSTPGYEQLLGCYVRLGRGLIVVTELLESQVIPNFVSEHPTTNQKVYL